MSQADSLDSLSATERKIFAIMRSKPGVPIPRKELLEMLHPGNDVEERTLDAHIKNIRRKLPAWRDWIETVRGVGYRIVKDEVS